MAKQKNEKDDVFLNELLELSGNEYGAITENGTTGDVNKYISTNSLLLNGLLSGSMFDGIAGNKITTFAGDASAGKTYIILDIVKNFLIENPTGYTIFFETESAISKQMLVERGLDTRRILMLPVATIQNFRTQILKILDKYLATKKSERKPMLFVLDSLGMLSTTKEVEDTSEGKETQDMTRARLIKGLFRVVTLKLGIADLPLLVTNHTYDEQGSMYPQKKMCLVGDTLIRTPGQSIAISEVQVGQKVITATGVGTTTQIHKYKTKKLFEIEMEDGSVIRCTDEHKFLTSDLLWISAKDLFPSDMICSIGIDLNMLTKQIRTIKEIDVEETEVYDITVDGQHHYILENGIVSHNSGGSGIALAGSTTVFLSKAKDKDGTDVIGNIITFKLIKGRLTKENSIAKVSLNYQTGLSKYYGLLEVSVEGGIAKRLGNKYTFDLVSEDPKYAFEKAIYKNPELYFTEDVLKKIDVIVGKMYKYGVGEGPSAEDEDDFDAAAEIANEE